MPLEYVSFVSFDGATETGRSLPYSDPKEILIILARF